MIRVLLVYLLPLLLPTALYLGWLWIMRRRAQASGGRAPALGEGPILWAVVGWVVLVAAGLVTWNLMTARHPSGELLPPRFIDGEIVPARPRPPGD